MSTDLEQVKDALLALGDTIEEADGSDFIPNKYKSHQNLKLSDILDCADQLSGKLEKVLLDSVKISERLDGEGGVLSLPNSLDVGGGLVARLAAAILLMARQVQEIDKKNLVSLDRLG